MLTFIPSPILVPSCASSSFRSPRQPPHASVPSSASSASAAISTSLRLSLVKGHRLVSIDLLLAAVDFRTRTYDRDAASKILDTLINTLIPLLPTPSSTLNILVPTPSAAVRVTSLLSSPALTPVSLLSLPPPSCDIALVLEPGSDHISELRALLREMALRGAPVIVLNHPREDDLYRTLGYHGGVPWEMTKAEAAFVLAPFALQKKDEHGNSERPTRFVIMRQFPGKWGLWRYVGQIEGGEDLFYVEEEDAQYELCTEFDERPSMGEVAAAVRVSL